MGKITTADCRKWLASNQKVQRTVWERYCPDEADCAQEKQEYLKVIATGKVPKNWKRNTKYKVGSKTDIDGGDSGGGLNYGNNPYVIQCAGVDPTGGVIREFWLDGTDHVTIAVLEKDEQLYFLEDLSD